jgi:FkbM family methyltransferase
MNLISRILAASNLFRSRYGQINGLALWLQLLKEKFHQKNEVFSVKVPGLKYPVFLRAHTSDIDAFCQIFGYAELDVETSKDIKYIVDAGANIGLSSIYLTNKYPSATIDAIEVSNDNIKILRKNLSSYNSVNIIPKGLWHRNATLRISNPDAEPWAFNVEETEELDPDGIPAIGINDLLTQRRLSQIDILKIDVEGAEASIFGSTETPWLSKVKYLMIELHDKINPNCSTAVFEKTSLLNHSFEKRGEYNIFTFRH